MAAREWGQGCRTTGWRIKACWLGAPASLLLCPSTANPGARPGKAPGRGLGPGHWPLHLPSPPPQPAGELGLWTCLRKEKEGRKEEGLEVAGSPGAVPRGHLHWPPGALPGGGRAWTAELGTRVSRAPSPCPRLAPPQSTLTSAAFICFIPSLSHFPGEGLGAGPVVNKHKPRWSRALCSGLRPSLPSTPPSSAP